jgi:hypothetical protein
VTDGERLSNRYAKVGSHLAAQIARYKVGAEFRLRYIGIATPSLILHEHDSTTTIELDRQGGGAGHSSCGACSRTKRAKQNYWTET